MMNVKIEVISSGCKKCRALFDLTEIVAKELNINEAVLYSNDLNKIVSLGLMSSPVLTLNDKPILVGLLPSKERLKEIISKNL